MENLITLLDRSLWEKITGKIKIAYLDTENHFLEQNFNKFEIINEFINDFYKGYKIRIIKIKLKDISKFKEASSKIKNKAITCGFKDFKEVYEETKERLS